MKNTGRTTSIARRIAWRFQWKRLGRILWQTVFMFLVVLVVWCIATEYAKTGSFRFDRARSITFDGFWWRFFDPDSVFRTIFSGNTSAFSYTVIYHFGSSRAYMSDFFFWLCFVSECLFGLRLAAWLLSCIRATERIRKYLKPIDDIAQVTESISSRGFDESKFHSLQDAIDHLNGASPDEQLHIGDDDLAGLETAVNNLIVRMHDGYRQQVRFVDDASHELRTPIAVIQGYADLLDRWGKTDEKVLGESIRAIRTETEHMKTLVEQLLFLARGDSGRQEPNMETLDLSALAKEVFDESRMLDEHHEYVLDVRGPVPVRGDEAMLKQAVRILTENAQKYSQPDTRITLRTYISGENACVDVQDNGMGISQADAPRIFDRFYRADAARESGSGGSGLGLSIARWIVARHGGRFQVRSYEGVGTRITILLPLGPP